MEVIATGRIFRAGSSDDLYRPSKRPNCSILPESLPDQSICHITRYSEETISKHVPHFSGAIANANLPTEFRQSSESRLPTGEPAETAESPDKQAELEAFTAAQSDRRTVALPAKTPLLSLSCRKLPVTAPAPGRALGSRCVPVCGPVLINFGPHHNERDAIGSVDKRRSGICTL